MYTVFIKELEFYGYHGVPDEEQKIGHRYRISASLEVLGSADVIDRVDETVDYGMLSKLIVEEARKQQFRTVERLAKHLCDYIIDKCKRVAAVEIEVAKLLPPTDAIVAEAGVRMRVTK